MNFDKGSRNRGGRGGGDHWGPGGRYNPDNTGCGKKTAEFVAVAALVLFAARKLFRT